MSAAGTGGPAFPRQHTVADANDPRFKLGCDGMTLRDYFAAKAMEAMVQGHFSHYGHSEYWPRDEIAGEAYELADAMLKERAK